MNELRIPTNLETISLNEQTNYRSIAKIKYYFDQEIKDQEVLTKKISKYITGFDYTGKSGTNIFAHFKTKNIIRIDRFCFFFIFLFKFWNN